MNLRNTILVCVGITSSLCVFMVGYYVGWFRCYGFADCNKDVTLINQGGYTNHVKVEEIRIPISDDRHLSIHVGDLYHNDMISLLVRRSGGVCDENSGLRVHRLSAGGVLISAEKQTGDDGGARKTMPTNGLVKIKGSGD